MTWQHAIIGYAAIGVLAFIVMVAAWPLAIWWKAREIWFSQGTEPIMEKEFAVEREHLLERQDVDALEAREVVTDPLGAVPELPFGHLNRAWLNFKAQWEPGDSIWTFSARWKVKWGREEIREGYAIVRLEGIGPHFLTKRRVLEND